MAEDKKPVSLRDRRNQAQQAATIQHSQVVEEEQKEQQQKEEQIRVKVTEEVKKDLSKPVQVKQEVEVSKVKLMINGTQSRKETRAFNLHISKENNDKIKEMCVGSDQLVLNQLISLGLQELEKLKDPLVLVVK